MEMKSSMKAFGFVVFGLIAMFLAPVQSATEPEGDAKNEGPVYQLGVDDAESARALDELGKGTSLCYASGASCVGQYGDLINHLFTDHNGTVRIFMSQMAIDAISGASYCELDEGVFVSVDPDGDGGEENILNQLYISRVADLHLTLRFWPRSSDGKCILLYVRALYGDQ